MFYSFFEQKQRLKGPLHIDHTPYFMGVIAFYQTYRQLEMDMARIFPTDPTKPLSRDELDGCPRKGAYIWR